MTIAQLDMFAKPIIPISRKRGTIAERFAEFHHLNAHVYVALVHLAREYRAATGSSHVGIAMLFERLRYEFAIQTRSQDGYKLNNSYRSHYARLIAAQEPDLSDAFEFRQLSAA